MDALKLKDTPKKKSDIDLRTVRGYMSHTTNTYQFGILERNQWVGEERLIKKTAEPFDYSIVARTNVRAFVVNKEEIVKKFPKEFMEFIEKEVMERYKWFEERARSLAKTSTHVAKMDPLNKKYDENLTNISKRFPIASKSILNNIRKHDLLIRSISPKRNIFQSNAALSLAAPMQNISRNEEGKLVSQRSMVKQGRLNISIASVPSMASIQSGALTERLLQPKNRYKVDIASVAPHYVNNKPVMPYFNKPLYKSRIASLAMMRMMGSRASLPLHKAEDKEEEENFEICNRKIQLLSKNKTKRTHTPNPYSIWHARIQSVAK
eukprot:TRINITY_DN2401_c0_g1_i1.p3 TRINITY_DN2401_c0_g1~~TRINITY_DN2401_c0_g1_i1.p3  ORF type:complete len:322 (-),score=34.08 TRINITY_DN2401_c0_g1_i1:3111-4076(-)